VKPSRFVTPMAARIADRLPEGRDWQYEVKFDGYRALLIKQGTSVQIRSRNDKDLTSVYPGVAAAARRLRAGSAIVDGEIVALDPRGRPSFQALQHRGAHPKHTVVFYAFDLLAVDGESLIERRLVDRRDRLPDVLDGSEILFSAELPGTAADVIEAVRGLGLEGVIAKRRDSTYIPGERSSAWVKVKLDRQQEFVIGGYRPGPYGIDAILVGYYDDGALRFASKVRAGFTPRVRRDVHAQLTPLHTTRCPFADLPTGKTSHWGGGVTEEEMAELQWLRPAVVAQIRFVEWTADAHLRHAAFLGLRADKPAKSVRRET
jgi:bifunctional non-homologous end joining protein LigD